MISPVPPKLQQIQALFASALTSLDFVVVELCAQKLERPGTDVYIRNRSLRFLTLQIGACVEGAYLSYDR